ncbi:hypothetical protein [Nitrososphaera viennensis]|uniref:Uncharacterized protein n=2 Tax=Nitrososphaera viennensis TaxID=1034015 RepID=A0A060HIE1_9ARCH|nr:hypothetical protein [Nitrososphaera viennensis]AIC16339.1 hypothetical protein NVIE_020790 [Nitrososphaera viennensis EN76]UVS68275.1 hypothetical protein NWT39_10240 [Nitrososphaera viennensis]
MKKRKRLMVWPRSVIMVPLLPGFPVNLVRRIAGRLERAQEKSLPDIEYV